VEEAAVAVIGVVGGELLSGGNAALLLNRCSGVAGELGESLGALVGVVSHYTTLIASDGGLVLGCDGNGVASSPWSCVGVVVVGVGGSHWGTVEVIGVALVVVVVVGMASWPRVSSTPVLKTGA
jgi:hypothetical protein